MYNLLIMQLIASTIIVGCLLVKVSYVILNKYLHPPYQWILLKARLAAGRKRWSSSADRIRCRYSSLKHQQLGGSSAGSTYNIEGNIAGENIDNAHIWGRDILSVSPNTLNQTRTGGQAGILRPLQMLERPLFSLWQMMYNIRKYWKVQNFTQWLYKIYLLCITS